MDTRSPIANPGADSPKWIYILHPYRGQGRPGEREANLLRIGAIAREILQQGHRPLSAVHALSFLDDHDPVQRDQALRLCQPLIALADEVWAFVGDPGRSPGPNGLYWIESAGCRHDHAVALDLGKPIRYYPYGMVVLPRSRSAVCETARPGV